MPRYRNLQKLPEWWSTACRRRPYYRDDVSTRFGEAVPSFGPCDGWVSAVDVRCRWSGGEVYECVQSWMVKPHLACNYVILLQAAEMVDETTGTQNGAPPAKAARLPYRRLTHYAYQGDERPCKPLCLVPGVALRTSAVVR